MKTEQNKEESTGFKDVIKHSGMIFAALFAVDWLVKFSKQSKIKKYYLRPYKKKMAEMTETEREFLKDLVWEAVRYDFDNKI